MKRLPLAPWHVYIIECRDHTLYTGITNNLSRRVSDHNKGNGGRYTRFRWPVKFKDALCNSLPSIRLQNNSAKEI
ncbi:MAG: GIY-YIG nuclease family protein [Candidatus Omnitrophota bacterium]